MPKDAAESLAFATAELAAGEFSRRRKAAKRSGRPAWLWREVSVERWTGAMRKVSAAAADFLADRRAALSSDDLMALSLACYTSGVGPLLGWCAENGQLDASDDVGELLRLHLRHARERAHFTETQSRAIVSHLSRLGVCPVVLKGGQTAHTYFPERATRPASDLDLLVTADTRNEAEAALSAAGLRCVSRAGESSNWIPAGSSREPRSLWLVRADDPWSVDLHYSLDIVSGAGGPTVRFDSAGPFSRTRPWALDPAANTLRQPLLLLHLATHASGGFQSLTLLRMVEMVLVARRDFADDGAAWNEFVATADRINGLAIAFPSLRMCESLAPGTIPTRVLEASANAAPARVRSIVASYEPATVQRVDRSSVTEHFMWATGLRSILRQVRSDIAPDGSSPESLWSIYHARANRLLHGRITR